MFVQTQNFGVSEELLFNLQCHRYNYRAHIHHFAELGYVIAGELEVTVGSRSYTAKAGDFVLIRPFEVHGYRTPATAHFFVCAFPGSLVPEFFESTSLLLGETVFRAREAAERYFVASFVEGGIDGRSFEPEKIPPIGGSPTDEHRLDLRSSRVLMQVKSAFYGVLGEYLPQSEQTSGSGESEPLVKLLLWLDAHFTEPISLSDAASELGYSANYLSHIIKRGSGMSFPEILGSLRVERAVRLLASPHGRMLDVALECGFATERSFNRTFLRHAGCTPSEYARLL